MAKAKKKILIIVTVALVAVVAVVGVVFKVNSSWALKVLCANEFEAATVKSNFSKDTYTLNEEELSTFREMLSNTVVYKKDPSHPDFVGDPGYVEITRKNKEQISIFFISNPDVAYVVVNNVWYLGNIHSVDKVASFIDNLYHPTLPELKTDIPKLPFYNS